MNCPNCKREIEDYSVFCEYCGHKIKKSKWPVVIVLCAIAVCVVVISLVGRDKRVANLKEQLSYLDYTNSELYEQNASLSQEKLGLTEQVEKLSYKNTNLLMRVNHLDSLVEESSKTIENLQWLIANCPIVITDVEIGNVDKNNNVETGYGQTIYSENTMYLKPKITYTTIRSGEEMDIYVKVYNPDSTLSVGAASPTGYSTQYTIEIDGSGTTYLGGWGNENKGIWKPGLYRYELWYKERMLFIKRFEIY